jgi:hypothetical protein
MTGAALQKFLDVPRPLNFEEAQAVDQVRLFWAGTENISASVRGHFLGQELESERNPLHVTFSTRDWF